MKCLDKEIGKYLLDYPMAQLAPSIAHKVGEHVAVCRACANRLRHLEWLRAGLATLAAHERERHLEADLLVAYALNREYLSPRHREQIENHTTVCESCSSELEILREVARDIDARADVYNTDQRSRESSQVSSSLIELRALASPDLPPELVIAADANDEEAPLPEDLATLYCDDPEVVVRIMSDPRTGEYLHVISTVEGLSSAIIVSLPEHGIELVTDETGHASLPPLPDRDYASQKWQLKLPEAVFDLDPLEFSTEENNAGNQILLESDRGDRVEVGLTGTADKKQIILRVLAVNGQTDFDVVRVAVTQDRPGPPTTISEGQRAVFDIQDTDQALRIRLYQ